MMIFHRILRLSLCVCLLSMALMPFVPTAVQADVIAPVEVEKKKKKKKKDAEIADPAPAPRPVAVTVVKGETVEIVLQAVTSTRKQVSFLLRTLPRLGTVQGPFPIPGDGVFDQAKLIYRCPIGAEGVIETFHFAARLENGVISGPARIDVRLIEAQPKLELPPTLDFGEVLIGESFERRVLVKNTGTAAYAAVPDVLSPWFAAEPGEAFVVPPGGEAYYRVLFAPTEAGPRRQLFTLGGEGPKSSTVFAGSGLAPFSVIPSVVKLDYDAQTGLRSGELKIINSTDSRKTLEVLPDEGVVVAKTIALPPRETVTIPVSLPKGTGSLDAGLSVRWNSHVETIGLQAEPEPARLRAGVPDFSGTLVLPRALERSERRAAFTVQNVGGKPGEVIVSTSAPFSVRKEDSEFVLEPGAIRDVLIGVRALESGLHEDTVRFVTGQQLLEIPVRATVVSRLSELNAPENPEAAPAVEVIEQEMEAEEVAGNASESPVEVEVTDSALSGIGDLVEPGGGDGGPSVVTSEMLALEAALAEAAKGERNAAGDYNNPKVSGTGDPVADARRKLETFVFQKGFGKPRKIVKSVPPVERARMLEQGKHSLKIGWDAPDGGIYEYELDRERLFYDQKTGKMSRLWIPHTSVEFTQKGNEVTAEISDLEFGGHFNFRLYTYEPGRGYSFSTPPFRIKTQSIPPGIPWPWIVVGILVALLIAVLAYQKLRNRNLGGRKLRR